MLLQPPIFHIAVIEDHTSLRIDLVEFLERCHFSVHGFENAEHFFTAWPTKSFDLVLIDIALPGASGLDVAQRIRADDDNHNTGIIMLTALDTNDDQRLGFNAGADIYLSKRSSLEVIEAACHSVLRRLGKQRPTSPQPSTSPQQSWHLYAKDWRLETPNGAHLRLTHTEVRLLHALCETPGQTISREILLTYLDKQETLFTLRNLDNTVSRLRRKVQNLCGLELPLRPSYGKGYTFAAHCELTS